MLGMNIYKPAHHRHACRTSVYTRPLGMPGISIYTPARHGHVCQISVYTRPLGMGTSARYQYIYTPAWHARHQYIHAGSAWARLPVISIYTPAQHRHGSCRVSVHACPLGIGTPAGYQYIYTTAQHRHVWRVSKNTRSPTRLLGISELVLVLHQ